MIQAPGASNAQAVYAVADALQIPLSVGKSGIDADFRVNAYSDKLKIPFQIKVKSDMYQDGKVGLLVHFRGNLWAYIFAASVGDTTKIDMQMVLFNGNDKGFADFKTGRPADTVKKLAKKIVASFIYSNARWEQVDELTFPKE